MRLQGRRYSGRKRQVPRQSQQQQARFSVPPAPPVPPPKRRRRSLHPQTPQLRPLPASPTGRGVPRWLCPPLPPAPLPRGAEHSAAGAGQNLRSRHRPASAPLCATCCTVPLQCCHCWQRCLCTHAGGMSGLALQAWRQTPPLPQLPAWPQGRRRQLQAAPSGRLSCMHQKRHSACATRVLRFGHMLACMCAHGRAQGKACRQRPPTPWMPLVALPDCGRSSTHEQRFLIQIALLACKRQQHEGCNTQHKQSPARRLGACHSSRSDALQAMLLHGEGLASPIEKQK